MGLGVRTASSHWCTPLLGWKEDLPHGESFLIEELFIKLPALIKYSVPTHRCKGAGGRWSRAHGHLRGWACREHTQALTCCHTNAALRLLLLSRRHRRAHASFSGWTSVQRELQHNQWYPVSPGMPKPEKYNTYPETSAQTCSFSPADLMCLTISSLHPSFPVESRTAYSSPSKSHQLWQDHRVCRESFLFSDQVSGLGALSPTLCSWPIGFLEGLISTYLTPCPGGLSPLLLLLLALSFFLFPAPARGDVINFLVLNLHTLNPFRQHSKRGDGSCCACLLCSLLEAVQSKKNTQNKSYWTGTFS